MPGMVTSAMSPAQSPGGHGRSPPARPGRRVDPVEDSAVVEVTGLRLAPASEDLVDGEESDLGQRMTRRGAREAWAVVVPRDRLLGLLRVEELEVRLRRRARPTPLDDRVHDGDGRLGEDARGGAHDLERAAAQLLQREIGL